MANNKFTLEENRMLTEIYRRLNYFHKGNLEHNMLLLGLPSEVKCLIKLGIIEPSYKETSRILNWYKLTDKGKTFFKNYILKIREETNVNLFNGVIETFDKSYIIE